jgi:DNA-directed RNA polymerase specialized sigma24 family protein
MKTQRDLTQSEFDRLLTWLDADRERAAIKYEVIRRGLIELFDARCCSDVEGLADRTINTVARKVEQIAPTYTGEPALYFYGVAKRILQEYFRTKTVPLEFTLVSPAVEEPDDREQLLECLDKCLENLSPDNHETILTYYLEAKRARIELRQDLTGRLGLTGNALRVKAHRIRKSLEKCILECVKHSQEVTNRIN